MRALKVLCVALVALAVLVPHSRAQGLPPLDGRSLPISLFERFLESLRQQAGIPGLSVAIVQNGDIVWDSAFGFQDVEALSRATADTPYPILDMSQALASTALLHRCYEQRDLDLINRVRTWYSQFPEDSTTVAQLLAHTAADGRFRYDTGRFANLTTVIEQCASIRYGALLWNDVLERLAMKSSVPGHDLADTSAPNRRLFSVSTLEQYSAVLRRVAAPYRVDSSSRKPTRADYARPSLTASTGVVSTVRDLARFDAGLNVLLASNTRDRAWQEQGSAPMGLGWFVQRYNGQKIVWQFGVARDAYSALYIRVPERNLSVILLANSDGLAAPYNLSDGDITTSLFGQLFLRLFVT